MTRADAAAFLAARYGGYLTAANRAATDTPGALGEVIDDALRALGVAEADLATATSADATEDADWRVQLAYRAMAQLSRDLGAANFDASIGGDSYKLSQVRAAAEKDLALAASAVLERFGTLGVIPSEDVALVWTLDLNYLADDPALETA